MSGRIRSIKPETLEDELMADLSDAAWRLYVASWVMADDHGCFRAGGRYLAAQVWNDTGKEKKAETALKELRDKGRVRCYVVGGQRYAEIRPQSWRSHQRIDHPGKPRVPVPNQNTYIDEVSRTVSEDIARPSDDIPTPSDGLAPRAHARDHRPPTTDQDHRPPTGGGAVESGKFMKSEPTADVRQVFDHWLRILAPLKFKRTPDLTPERQKIIESRLGETNADELCRAIDGVRKSPHHCGQNESGEVYVDFATIFRNRTKVEGHIARADGKPMARASPEHIDAMKTGRTQETLLHKFENR